MLVRQNDPTQPLPWPQDICSSSGSQNTAQWVSEILPLMTAPCPILNLNGRPRSREESNFFPLVSVPVMSVCGEREEVGVEWRGVEDINWRHNCCTECSPSSSLLFMQLTSVMNDNSLASFRVCLPCRGKECVV